MSSAVFPFSAIIGQQDMKLALLMAAIDPALGGVLVFGDRGTGKTTAMRGLAALLPERDVVAECAFACDPARPATFCADCQARAAVGTLPVTRKRAPVVDLPLGATEDRVTGALDIEKALAQGIKAFEPGILAAANRGFLYVDEVNLLEDHLVDLLLDVAVSGINMVERDGLSVRHPARFILVGSGNPEEGELRPQLLDRFGLSVDVVTPSNIDDRIAIVRSRDAFDSDPEAFSATVAEQEDQVRQQVIGASARLADVTVGDAMLRTMSELCVALGTDGLRGELTLMRACRAAAALAGKSAVTRDDILQVAPMALRHRLRRDPLDDSGSTVRVERALTTLGLAA